MTEAISLVDMGTFLEGSPEGRARVAKAIFHSAHNVGFTYLTNVGMSEDLLDAAFAVSKAFFASDEKFSVPFDPEVNHGYTGLRGEALDPSHPPDLKETFTCRDLARKPSDAGHWPNPHFEAFMRVFHRRLVGITEQVMAAFELALELPDGFLAARHTGLNQTLRLLHYPPMASAEEGQLGAGAHTDYGTLTLLFQDDAGGLQVQGTDGHWIDAPPIPGTVVINTGDLIARWSNDCFRSTPHRVVTRPAAMRTGRQSIAFFSDPDPDVLIETFPSCATSENPPRYEPITAGDYIQQRIMATQT